MSFIEYAKKEFQIAGWTDENGNFKDEMQEKMCKSVLGLLELFSDENHSGFSASYAINLFNTLVKFEPLTPLTGEDTEWSDVDGGMLQNKRCSRVFKNIVTGKARDIDGKILWRWDLDEDGKPYKSYHTNSRKSSIDVTFPYTPFSVYEYDYNPEEDTEYPPQTEAGIL